jgi:hypothetical protein
VARRPGASSRRGCFCCESSDLFALLAGRALSLSSLFVLVAKARDGKGSKAMRTSGGLNFVACCAGVGLHTKLHKKKNLLLWTHAKTPLFIARGEPRRSGH